MTLDLDIDVVSFYSPKRRGSVAYFEVGLSPASEVRCLLCGADAAICTTAQPDPLDALHELFSYLADCAAHAVEA